MAIKRTSNNSLSNAPKMSTGFSSAAIPNTPTIGTATKINDVSATVTYTAAVLGATATSFSALSTPGSLTGSGSSPITISGLTPETSYTFTVRATNANGNSAYSSASNEITTDPILDSGAMFPLGMVTLAGTASYIEFTSIPQTYKHLQLRFLTAAPDAYTDGYIAFNGDTTSTNYYANRIFGNGNATGNTAQNTNYNFNGWGTGETNLFVAGVVDILNYSDSTKRKVSRNLTGFSNNVGANTNNWIAQHSLVWNNTNAITSLRIYYVGTNILANSQATLYGIKGA